MGLMVTMSYNSQSAKSRPKRPPFVSVVLDADRTVCINLAFDAGLLAPLTPKPQGAASQGPPSSPVRCEKDWSLCEGTGDDGKTKVNNAAFEITNYLDNETAIAEYLSATG